MDSNGAGVGSAEMLSMEEKVHGRVIAQAYEHVQVPDLLLGNRNIGKRHSSSVLNIYLFLFSFFYIYNFFILVIRRLG